MKKKEILTMRPVEIVIVGAGDRGNVYASYAIEHPDLVKVVGVAEPRDFHRQRMVKEHGIPPENVFTDWKDLAERERFADAVVIATQDSMHLGPAIAFADKGYHMLLEKPIAPDEDSCKRIIQAVLDNKILFAVGHVLRYTRYTKKLKEIIASGVIGDVVSLHRLEPVGYWHQAHSFVRGNWRREDESSSMLLAKSCHDLDWIRYIVGKSCRAVSSFGSLFHFKKENKPEGAGDSCTKCDYEPNCPYSAKKIYLGFFEDGNYGWPVSVITPEVTKENIMEAITTGPYGRCVYECDNDVVDHQVVTMEFDGGITASFTMTAFTEAGGRRTSIFGTSGEINGDGTTIKVFDFLSDTAKIYDTTHDNPMPLEGHGGGDYGLIKAFVEAVSESDAERILSGPEETLESHLMVFAAEKSRKERRTVLM
ncbi:MAG: oxidoreductase [Candidatus Thorarchaeota archaeon SMTZ-45]|nr:MAG: oxidoreductase [Candidatus Thorarchaeota archaeon SMTZ-45]